MPRPKWQQQMYVAPKRAVDFMIMKLKRLFLGSGLIEMVRNNIFISLVRLAAMFNIYNYINQADAKLAEKSLPCEIVTPNELAKKPRDTEQLYQSNGVMFFCQLDECSHM